jgi:hypothetical protein
MLKVKTNNSKSFKNVLLGCLFYLRMQHEALLLAFLCCKNLKNK